MAGKKREPPAQLDLFAAPAPPAREARPVSGKPILDLAEARRRRDHGIVIVDKSAAFAEAADRAIMQAARTWSAFCIDEVWQFVDGDYDVDKRAMGSAIMRAVRAHVITGSEDFRHSAQRQCHANPRRIWISRIHTAPRMATG